MHGGDTLRGHAWLPAVKASGLTGFRVHDLRHSYVSQLIAAGANVKQVSRWAGHSSVTVTLDVYAHLFESDGDDIADALDTLLQRPTRATSVAV